VRLFVSSLVVLRGPRGEASDSPADRNGGRGGQVPARGPAGVAVMRAPARVTSRRGHTRKVVPGAAVRDAGRGDGRRDPAGQAPGDIAQHADQVADAPVAGPLVVPPARSDAQDAARVADRDGADPARGGPADHRAGGLVLGLADPAGVPRLHDPLAAPVLPPAPRPALPGFGGAAGDGPAPCPGVLQVQVVLGADRPPPRVQLQDAGPHVPGRDQYRTSRRRCPRVSRKPARAVRYTTAGRCGSRCLGMPPSHQQPPTNKPAGPGGLRRGGQSVDYDESVCFTGLSVGTCHSTVDTACGPYLHDPTAWTDTRRTYGRHH
jgi:hypothetical protein